MLSTSLLLGSGGGAIAFADLTDTSGGASAGTPGTGGQGSQGTAPTGTPGDQPATGVTTMGSDDDPSESTAPTSTVDAQTNQTDGEEGTVGSNADDDPSESTAPTSESNAPETNAPTSGSNEPAPLSNVPPSDSSAPAAASTPPAAPAVPPTPTVSKVVVEPMTDAFATIARALGSSAVTFAALPSSETPVADIITSMQEMLSSVAGAGATLAQVSSDIYTLLGVSQDIQPSLIGAGGALTGAAPVPDESGLLFGPLTSQLPQLPPAGGDAPLFGTVVHASTVGGVAATGLNQLTLSGLAPLAPAGVDGGAGSFFDHVVSAVLVPASLTALAAIALPGVGGLLIVIGAGMRFGYRQAKAAFIMRTSGIARFAGPGPLGVVRSGSLISLHTRADRPKPAHGAHRKQAHATRHLERAA